MSDTIDKKLLINIAKELPASEERCSLYGFAAKFCVQMKDDKKSDNKDLFAMIEFIERCCKGEKIINCDVKNCLGKIGGKGSVVSEWCNDILNNDVLKGLSIDELNYVMGYAERFCKVSINDNVRGAAVYSVTENSSKDLERERKYVCSNCGAELNLPFSPREFSIKIKCAVCGKKVKAIEDAVKVK